MHQTFHNTMPTMLTGWWQKFITWNVHIHLNSLQHGNKTTCSAGVLLFGITRLRLSWKRIENRYIYTVLCFDHFLYFFARKMNKIFFTSFSFSDWWLTCYYLFVKLFYLSFSISISFTFKSYLRLFVYIDRVPSCYY